ncbi:AbrB/MazE/SpoVT family DNA-binding domain-containing protein [Glaciimonas sp. GG7]
MAGNDQCCNRISEKNLDLYHLTQSKDFSIFTFIIKVKRYNMSILSLKRQVTLPKELCDRLFVIPGDDLTFLEHQGRITIIKKIKGSSDGALRHLKGNAKYSDSESLQDTLAKKHDVHPAKKHAA